MAAFTDIARAAATSIRRLYYRRVVFARVNADFGMVVLGADVCRRFHLVAPQNLSIGRGTVLNGDCYINAQGGVSIGRYCHIGKGLTVFSSNHNHRSKASIPYDKEDILKPVDIGDAVWIGANVSIAPGSRIGHGAIIAMGSVVRGEVPTCAVVAGNPAKVVTWRDREVFAQLHRAEAFE